MSLFSGLSGAGFLGSGLQSFMGGGGGGGGGGIGGSLLSGLGNIFSQGKQAASYGKDMPTSMGTRSAYELDLIKKSISDSIEGNQFSGYGDPFSKRQSQLFPQFGGQSGFTGAGFGGMNFGQPTSSIGGFQYGVGLGSPAGFQTQSQTKQDYLMNFASPTAPIAPGRGNLVYDFLNQNSNPFGYQNGYATGGRVRFQPIQRFVTGSEGGVRKKPYVTTDLTSVKGGMYTGIGRIWSGDGKLLLEENIVSGSPNNSKYPGLPQGDYDYGKFQWRDPKDKNYSGYAGSGSKSLTGDPEKDIAYSIPLWDKNRSGFAGRTSAGDGSSLFAETPGTMFDPIAQRMRDYVINHPDGGAIGSLACPSWQCGPERQQEILDLTAPINPSTGKRETDVEEMRVRYSDDLKKELLSRGDLLLPTSPEGRKFFKNEAAAKLEETKIQRLWNNTVDETKRNFELAEASKLNKGSENRMLAQNSNFSLPEILPFTENTTLAENVQPKANAIIASAKPAIPEPMKPTKIAALNLPSSDLVKKPLDEKFYAARDEYMKNLALPKANSADAQPVSRPALSDMFSGLRNNVKKAGGMFSNGIANIAGMGRSGMNSLGGMLNNTALPKMNIPTVAPSGGGIGGALGSSLGGLGNLAKSGYGKVYDAMYNLGGTMASPFPYEKALIDFPASVNNNLSNMKIPAIGGGAGGIGGALMASLGGMKNLAGKGYDALYDLGGNLYDKFGPKPMIEGPNTKAAGTIPKNLIPEDLLNPNKQSAEQILPFFQNLADIASENKQNLYKSVGSLYDMKNKGDYGKLSSKFSSFYGNNQNNRYSSFGEKGFNNYLKYIGADPYSTMSSLNSFKSPMTPNTYSPFAFGSQNFGGFGGSGYQSGFSSTGNAFSNYFSTGSRLGITPSWASKAAGGMIYGGTSTKDDVPAMLMGGEYVIRKDVVDRMGEPFFNSLNRGKPQGFAEGGPVGTGLPSVVGGGSNQQDNSRGQFVDSITKLVKSLEQLNKGIEEQNKDSKMKTNGESESSDSSSSGVTNNISINVNVDQNGKTTDSKKEEDQSGGGSKEETDQEKFKKTMEKSRILAELLRQQVLKTIVEEQRPGGVLYGGSKGRDMGR